MLKYAFSDAPQLYPAINQLSLEGKPLINITRRYHDLVCDSAKCIIYQKQVQGFKFRFAPFISMNISSLNLYNVNKVYGSIAFQTAYYPTIGLQMSSPIPWTNEKITLHASAEIGKCSFSGSGYYPESTISEEADFHPVLTTGKLGIKYSWPTGRIRPTVYGRGYLDEFNEYTGEKIPGKGRS